MTNVQTKFSHLSIGILTYLQLMINKCNKQPRFQIRLLLPWNPKQRNWCSSKYNFSGKERKKWRLFRLTNEEYKLRIMKNYMSTDRLKNWKRLDKPKQTYIDEPWNKCMNTYNAIWFPDRCSRKKVSGSGTQWSMWNKQARVRVRMKPNLVWKEMKGVKLHVRRIRP